MEERYHRNRLYISSEEQDVIRNYPVLFAGSGIGSVIAECALRLGFENITIVDGDQVELSNLNRQNYIEKDISANKAEATGQRLQAINERANITVYSSFITEANMEVYTSGQKVVVNALDFTTDIPLQLDRVCKKENIPVIHPYNLGWRGFLTVVTSESMSLSFISRPNEEFNELNIVEYMTSYMRFWGNPQTQIDDIVLKYKSEEEKMPPPQLSIASWEVAAMCTHILYNIATGKPFKKFPEFYLSTSLDI